MSKWKGKIVAALMSVALFFGATSLTACSLKKDEVQPDSYAGLVERRDDLLKELSDIEKQINELMSRDSEVKAVRDAVSRLQDKIAYEKIKGPEILVEIENVTRQIESINEDGLIGDTETIKMKKTLGEVKKGVFYSVVAQGIENRAAGDPIMETREVKSDGETLKIQTAVNFGSRQLVKNEVTTADMLYSNVNVIDGGVSRSCVVGESYSEEAGDVSKKNFIDSFKEEMKRTIDAATELSYDVNSGYTVVSTAEYNGDVLDTTLTFNVDEDNCLTTMDQTYETLTDVVAEIGTEYSSITSSHFASILAKAQKTLDQQSSILSDEK